MYVKLRDVKGQLCGDVQYTEGESIYEVDCGGKVGNKVKVVQRDSARLLTLCEVKVFGTPLGIYNLYLA